MNQHAPKTGRCLGNRNGNKGAGFKKTQNNKRQANQMHQVINMEHDGVLLVIHHLVGYTGVMRIENESATFQVLLEFVAPK